MILFLLVTLCISCQNEDELSSKSVLLTQEIKQTELDNWIYENYTKPFGIAVNYKGNTTSFYPNTYPPKEDKVLPILKALKALWIDLYDNTKNGGEGFIRNTPPININLYGNKNIVNGREEIGTSGSALTIHIFDVDSFENTKESVFKLLRSVHHSYAKRLIEQKPFDKDAWKEITLYQFYQNWHKDYSNDGIYDAFFKPGYFFGFYSILARKSIKDDFAETVSILLTYTNNDIEELIELSKYNDGPGIPYFDFLAQNSHKSLQRKREFVIQYFKENWLINLRRMQNISVANTVNYTK